MRPSLRWLLGFSLLLSGAAMLLPAPQTPILDAPPTGVASAERPAATRQAALPARLPVVELERATFDPFAGVQPAQPPAPASAASALPRAVPIAEPTPPAPPAISYRFLGRMTDPEGKSVVYLAGSGRELQVSVGTTLPEGYVVESMDEAGVHLRYPPLDARAIVSIPRTE